MQQFSDEDVGYFCFWEQGSGGSAPNSCFSGGRPFSGALTNQVSIDGTEATICGLRVSTCIAFNQFSALDCAPSGTPDDSLCGFSGGNDGTCRFAGGGDYSCTMLCGANIDCKIGFDCDVDECEVQ
jgi:hypothetical protein